MRPSEATGWPPWRHGGEDKMSSHTLYVREAAACQRAAEQTRDPVLARQLWREQTMWLGLARLSAAVEGLALAIVGGSDDPLPTGA